MGLGLALVRSIARAHGGDATVTSDGRNKGTRFTVRIPAADQLMIGEHLRKTSVSDVRRVLLVEDDDDNRELLAASLRDKGYHVQTASTGTDALDALEQAELDIAIMDIGLPDMSGIEVAKRARRFAPALYLVALTGHGRQSDRDAIVDAGFDIHLVKPVRMQVLEEVIRDRPHR
jgi:two-component system CheB/CheR fusion protein